MDPGVVFFQDDQTSRRMTFFNECWPAGGGQATAAAFRVSGPEPEPGSGTR